MEAFSSSLQKRAQDGGSTCHPKCEELQISHVCFANDLFILDGADVRSINIMKGILDDFSHMPGLFPNPQRSSSFISDACENLKSDIFAMFNMEVKEYQELRRSYNLY